MIEAVVGVALRAILASVLLGGVLAALVLVATRTLALTAGTRHALWTTALIATALMPLAGVGVSIARATAAATPATARPVEGHAGDSLSTAHASAAQPLDVGVAPVTAPRDPANALPPANAAARTTRVTTAAAPPWFAARLAAPGRLAFTAWTPRVSRALALGFVVLWALGAAIGTIGLVASVARVRGLKRRSRPLDGRLAGELPWLTEARSGREIYVRLSYETETPVAIGFRRPVILIPTELATADGLGAIEPLILHEYAHLRRNDDWTNLLQRAIERAFWFNPVVWYVGRRIALEREIASDDAVVEKTGEAHAYATSLWQLAREMRMPEHAVVAPGALLTRKQITVRIEQLLDKKRARLHRSPAAALGVALAGVLAVTFVATSAPGVELPAAASPVATESAQARHQPAWRPASWQSPTAPARAKVSAVPMHAHVFAKHRAIFALTVVRQRDVSPPRPPAASRLRATTESQFRAAQDQLKLLRAQLAAATNPRVVHERTIRIVDTSGDAPAPAPPAAPFVPSVIAPLPRLPIFQPPVPAISPQAMAKLQTLAASAGARAVRARAAVRATSYDADIDRTIDRVVGAAFAAIPRAVTSDPAAAPRRVRYDGAKLTREIVASCMACSFRNADARGLDLHDLTLTADNFTGADMRGVNLNGAKLAAVSLARANLSNADMRGAALTGVELRDAKFNGVQFDGVRFSGVAVRSLGLRGANLRSVMANCVGCDFSGVDLHGQDLHGLMLTGIDLNHADLREANLSGVHFASVNLSHANLAGADLTDAFLETCDLDGTDLRNARTSGMMTHAGGLSG